MSRNTFTTHSLLNGMRVILAPKKGTQAMTALVFVTIGSRYEPESTAGISHFLEHMCFKGTKKRPSARIISRTLDSIGAEYNAYTSKEFTGYYIKADSRHTALALDVLSDIYYNSLFDAREIEREKGPVCQEIKMYEDNPLRSIADWFDQALFLPHTLGRDIVGSIKTVRGLTRKDVVDWHATHYHPANTTVVLAGRIEPGALTAIRRYFRQKRAGVKPERALFCASSGGPRVVLKLKKTDQVQVMLGFPGFGYGHQDKAALQMLQIILGGGMSSRLFIAVRERRGLAYLVRAGFDEYIGTGSVHVHAGVDKEKLPELFTVVLNELNRLKTHAVSVRELRDAKEQWRGHMVLSSEDSSWQAEWYAEQVFAAKVNSPEHVLRFIQKVTAVDIKRVAQGLIQWDRLRVAIIGSTIDTKGLERHIAQQIKHFA